MVKGNAQPVTFCAASQLRQQQAKQSQLMMIAVVERYINLHAHTDHSSNLHEDIFACVIFSLSIFLFSIVGSEVVVGEWMFQPII